jgi:hypothetical protein
MTDTADSESARTRHRLRRGGFAATAVAVLTLGFAATALATPGKLTYAAEPQPSNRLTWTGPT